MKLLTFLAIALVPVGSWADHSATTPPDAVVASVSGARRVMDRKETLALIKALPEVRTLLKRERVRFSLLPDEAEIQSCTGSAFECTRKVRVETPKGTWHYFFVDAASRTIKISDRVFPRDLERTFVGAIDLATWRSRSAR